MSTPIGGADIHHDLFIDGTWTASHGTNRVEVVNPASEKVIGDVSAGDPRDVDDAVVAARSAFPAWAALDPNRRGHLVAELADELERRQEEITDIVVAEVGTPRRIARWLQVGFGIMDLREASAGVDEVAWERPLRNSLIIREPVGVVGCITPWNYPLHQITAKTGAALSAGCTLVLKASEVAPFTARAFAEAVEAVGFPPGVFNLVQGYGPSVGEAIVTHPGVDMVSFTGSNNVGKRIAELTAQSVKRLSLELGGKSASIVLDDADFARAITATVRSAYLNMGQSCASQSRLLVPRGRLREVEDLVRGATATYVPGDPTDESTRLGPIVNERQRDRVLSYIQIGIDEGAALLVGGVDRPADLPHGYYVMPTVFSDVEPNFRIAQEEIFGPVLSILPYNSDDEAVTIANGTIYGLAGAVWSADQKRAQATARRIRAAQIDVNGGAFNPAAPFGGFKQSGVGREGGSFGIEEFLELKSLQL